MYSHSFSAMTVPCQLLLTGECTADLTTAALAVEQNTKRLENKYNFYQQDSWLNSVINNRQLASVVLDKETAQVLTSVRQLSEATLGCFDITVGTLKRTAMRYPDMTHQQLFAHCENKTYRHAHIGS